MSETKFKAPRTIQEIQQDYQSTCAKAGHTQYQMEMHSRDLKLLNDTLRDLNAEAMACSQAMAEAKAKADAEAKAKADAEKATIEETKKEETPNV